MIADFRCKDTKALFDEGNPRRFSSFASVALRKLDMLDAAKCLEDLRIPPANRLEQLKGDRAGQHSIRINACLLYTSPDQLIDPQIGDGGVAPPFPAEEFMGGGNGLFPTFDRYIHDALS